MKQNCRVCGNIRTTFSGEGNYLGACYDCTRRAIEELEGRECSTTLRSLGDMKARHEGIYLESVGTWVHHDGWTYPVRDDNTVAITTNRGRGESLAERRTRESLLEGGGHRIDDIDPDGEGYDWWEALSWANRDVVECLLDRAGHGYTMRESVEEARTMQAHWTDPNYSGAF